MEKVTKHFTVSSGADIDYSIENDAIRMMNDKEHCIYLLNLMDVALKELGGAYDTNAHLLMPKINYSSKEEYLTKKNKLVEDIMEENETIDQIADVIRHYIRYRDEKMTLTPKSKEF